MSHNNSVECVDVDPSITTTSTGINDLFGSLIVRSYDTVYTNTTVEPTNNDTEQSSFSFLIDDGNTDFNQNDGVHTTTGHNTDIVALDNHNNHINAKEPVDAEISRHVNLLDAISEFQHRYENTITSHWAQYRGINESAVTALKHIQQLQTQLSACTEQLVECETAQLQCIECEDYTTAELHSITIQNTQKQINTSQTELHTCQNSFNGIQQQKHQVLQQLMSDCKQYQLECEALQGQNNDTDRVNVNQLNECMNQVNQQIEQIQIVLQTADNELSSANASVRQIQSDIQTSLQSTIEQRDTLKLAALQCQQEIVDLQQQLERKQMELAGALNSITVLDQSIDEHSVNDQLQIAIETQQQITHKSTTAQRTLDELQQKQHAIQTQIEQTKQQDTQATITMKTIAQVIDTMLSTSRQLLDNVRTTDDTATNDNALAIQLKQLNQIISELQQQVDNIKHNIVVQQTLLVTLTDRETTLQADKATAVSLRDFKRAANDASQLKSLLVDKQDVANKITVLQQELATTERQLQEQQHAQQQIKIRLDQLRVERDSQLYNQLETSHKQLSNVQQSLVGLLQTVDDSTMHSCLSAMQNELEILGLNMQQIAGNAVTNHMSAQSNGHHEQLSDSSDHSSIGTKAAVQSTDRKELNDELEAAIVAENFDKAEELQRQLSLLQQPS